MDGTWLFKLDNHQSGPAARVRDRRLEAGHRPQRLERRRRQRRSRSLGGVGWYRKDFRLPEQPPSGRRGSCASSRSTTARRSGSTASRSARTAAPTCRSRSACRRACSSAAASTTSSSASTARRQPTDFPPVGPVDRPGTPTGGWWNYGGLLREVYLRKINDIDFNTVVVRPDLPCATCAATVTLPRHAAQLRRAAPRRVAVSAPLRRAAHRRSARVAIGAKRFATLTKQIKVDKPRLWSPATPVPLRRVAGRPLGRRRCCSATRCGPASARSRSSAATCSSTARR